MGSNSEITRPVKGSGWTQNIVSPNYVAAKFGNALRFVNPQAANAEIVDSGSQTIPLEGCIEFWIEFFGWSWTNTTSSDSKDRVPINRETNANPFVAVNFFDGVGILYDINTSNQGGNNNRLTVSNQSFSSGEVPHLAFSWKEAGASGLMKMFRNGVEVGSRTANLGLTGAQTTTYTIGTFGQATTASWDGYVDNYKFHEFFKTDFTDRERPRFGMLDNAIAH